MFHEVESGKILNETEGSGDVKRLYHRHQSDGSLLEWSQWGRLAIYKCLLYVSYFTPHTPFEKSTSMITFVFISNIHDHIRWISYIYIYIYTFVWLILIASQWSDHHWQKPLKGTRHFLLEPLSSHRQSTHQHRMPKHRCPQPFGSYGRCHPTLGRCLGNSASARKPSFSVFLFRFFLSNCVCYFEQLLSLVFFSPCATSLRIIHLFECLFQLSFSNK